jgi:hypothetical protein
MLVWTIILAVVSCGGSSTSTAGPAGPVVTPAPAGSFGDDLAFLRQHVEVIVLRDAEGAAQVAVVPEYQGRVMTSTANGEPGPTLGWIHRPVIARGQRQEHMTVLGGEDRFWVGPEGGQFALYFAPGDPFDLAHWQVPEAIDWGGWDVVEQSATHVAFRRAMQLRNWSGTAFDARVDRTVRLLDRAAAGVHLGVPVPEGVAMVAYQSENTLANAGAAPWQRETGLLSVWILSMYPPSPGTTVVIPFRAGTEAELGRIVNDAYFGAVPADRLVVRDGVLFFRADGERRSKIGIPRPRAASVLGSYDAARGILTIVQLTVPEDARDYVNSLWEQQRDPYGGDVVNSYNDGPPAPGQPPLGPFYELESSSPALALAPGQSHTHVHRTFHLVGTEAALDPISRHVLGVGIAEIRAAFPAPAAE